jgi:hypothetical protein
MRWPSLFLGALPIILALVLAVPVEVHAGAKNRGLAVLSPVESPDAFGIAAGGSHGGVADPRATYTPYYSIMIPVSPRWRAKHLVHYYRGYWKCCRNGPYPLGICGAMPGEDCCCAGEEAAVPVGLGDYGGFTGASQDEATLMHLGGGGLNGPHAGPPDDVVPPHPGGVVVPPQSGGDVVPPRSGSGYPPSPR